MTNRVIDLDNIEMNEVEYSLWKRDFFMDIFKNFIASVLYGLTASLVMYLFTRNFKAVIIAFMWFFIASLVGYIGVDFEYSYKEYNEGKGYYKIDVLVTEDDINQDIVSVSQKNIEIYRPFPKKDELIKSKYTNFYLKDDKLYVKIYINKKKYDNLEDKKVFRCELEKLIENEINIRQKYLLSLDSHKSIESLRITYARDDEGEWIDEI